MFALAFSGESHYNGSRWDNARFNELLVNARAELDEKKRGEMFGEMQRLLHDNSSMVIPVFAEYVEASSDKLNHGKKISGNTEMDGQRITERWWFDS